LKTSVTYVAHVRHLIHLINSARTTVDAMRVKARHRMVCAAARLARRAYSIVWQEQRATVVLDGHLLFWPSQRNFCNFPDSFQPQLCPKRLLAAPVRCATIIVPARFER